MRKILEKIYPGIICAILTTLMIVLRSLANDNLYAYCIGLMIIAVACSFFTIVFNKYKKPIVRRFYVAAIVSISLSIISHALMYLVCSNTTNTNLFKYFEAITLFPYAAFIAISLFLIFFLVKDLFKKDYEVSKLDVKGFVLLINVLVYGALFLINFYTKKPTVNYHYDPVNLSYTGLSFVFSDLKEVILYFVIANVIYIASYIILEFLSYNYFEKDKGNKNSRDFK